MVAGSQPAPARLSRMPIEPLQLTAYTLTTALGRGRQSCLEALREQRSGLRPCDFETADLPAWIGRVDAIEDQPINGALQDYDCRNNRLAEIGLQQDGFTDAVGRARERYGEARIGVFLGTSTSGIHDTELAYRARQTDSERLPDWFHYDETHNVYSVARYVRERLGLTGPAMVISTACSSSARAFATAYRYIQAGWCDAAIVGGVDSLCLTTLYGFSSLQLVSTRPCRPADRNRDGISIGEAAGFALLERAEPGTDKVCLLGYGESSDAYHMSSPDPEGSGAALAMQGALVTSGLRPAQIDYVNLHGTATQANDISEDKGVTQVFGPGQAASSTKGWTGHALGAAGIVEAVIGALCVEHGMLPRSLNTDEVDPVLQSRILQENEERTVQYVMSNSFGFGGNNCSLVLGRRDT